MQLGKHQFVALSSTKRMQRKECSCNFFKFKTRDELRNKIFV
uniref:Orphan protein n=1 Tax=Ascaris lumbricoides TaxID=6252 RepID=A0A0M3HLB7_ASCLU